MGTAGSMWDTLFEGDLSFGPEADDLRWPIVEATDRKAVTQDLLAGIEKLFSDRLGFDLRLSLIPYCRTEQEQIELLRIMAEHVAPRDQVHIDISHGFRHLPMIALLAALHLRAVREAAIDGIWYGAFDPDTNEAPVHNLAGLLRTADWIQALHTYDKDGDYGVFASLLGSAGGLLAQAAFFERATNPVKAREKLSAWSQRKDRFPANDPAAELFRDELERRVSWHRKPDRASWEAELALRYLEQGDYVRAAVYGLEAVISSHIANSKGNVGDYNQRQNAQEALKDGRDGFDTLSRLRNALAHGFRPWDGKIERAIADETDLRNTLQTLLTQLLNIPSRRGG